MANTIASTNMALPVPVVGVDPGPQYASDINTCLTLIDAHDHSSGKGVQITPSGININADFPININNLTLARTVRFSSQSGTLSGASDVGCLYEVGVDLYYNDGSGNKIRITQSGGIVGSPGSISGLVSPASATYVSATQTFVWQSAANTAANLDAGSLLMRNITSGSNALTLSPPASLGSNYSIVLPTLPASQKFVTLDASGNMAAPWAVDNSTIEVNANTVQLKNGGVTRNKSAGTGIQFSSSCGAFTTASTSPVDVTNLNITITTTGNPVALSIRPETISGSISYTGVGVGSAGSVNLVRGSTTIATFSTQTDGNSITIPSSSINYIDVPPSAGTYTYKIQQFLSTGASANFYYSQLVAYEIF